MAPIGMQMGLVYICGPIRLNEKTAPVAKKRSAQRTPINLAVQQHVACLLLHDAIP